MGKLRKSRWTTKPREDHPHVLEYVNEHQLSILQLLEPRLYYKYLASNWLRVLVPKNKTNTSNALVKLATDPNNYVEADRDRRFPGRHFVYNLTDKGRRELLSRGKLVDMTELKKNQAAHDLIVYTTLASIEYGAQNLLYTYVPWRDLLFHPDIPEETRRAKNHIIKMAERTVHPDGYPFIIQTDRKTYHFPGLEVQMGTEGIDTEDKTRPSFSNKFAAYKEFIDKGYYRSHFGFENCLVPFIFVNERHMWNSIAYVEKHYGKCAWMLFKLVPNLPQMRNFPEPSPYFWDTPWMRAGYPPALLSEI